MLELRSEKWRIVQMACPSCGMLSTAIGYAQYRDEALGWEFEYQCRRCGIFAHPDNRRVAATLSETRPVDVDDLPEVISSACAHPSQPSWEQITEWVSELPISECLELLPALKAALEGWSANLLTAPKHWVQALFGAQPAPFLLLLPIVPVQSHRIRMLTADVEALADSANLAWCRGLDVSHTGVRAIDIDRILTSIHCTGLLQLTLSDCDITDTWYLTVSSNLQRLRSLNLAGNQLSGQGMCGLMRSRWLNALDTLDISRCQLDEHALRHLSESRLPALTTLSLRSNPLSARAQMLLAEWSRLGQLKSLDCSNIPLDGKCFAAICQRSTVLEQLDVTNTGLNKDDVSAVTGLPALRSVALAATEGLQPLVKQLLSRGVQVYIK